MIKRKMMSLIVSELKSSCQNIAKLKTLLKDAKRHEVDLNARYYRGRTLLHYAAKSKIKGVIPLLSKLGVDVRLCDFDYNTPLHIAVICNSYASVRDLLKIENIDINATGEFEQTALHLAVTLGNIDIIKLLIKNGADYLQVDEKNLSSYDYALDENDEKIISYFNQIIAKRKEIA